MQAKNFGESWLDLQLPFPCEVHHCYPRAIPDPSVYAVLVHTGEPSALKWDVAEVRTYAASFDLIVTSDVRLLDLANAVFLILGNSWVKQPPARKEFSLSFLWSAGIGAAFPGYTLRGVNRPGFCGGRLV